MGSAEWLAISVVVGGFLLVALAKAIGRGIRWMASEVAAHVVEAIGDTLSVRWNADMEEALEPIMFELSTNGGNSLRDKVNEMDDRLIDIEQQLENEFNWKPRRRFDDPDGYPV